MKATVIGVMRSHLDAYGYLDVSNENMKYALADLKRFSGAEAGICYMSKPYFDSYVSDKGKAYDRFSTVAETGHHSIAGHAQVGMLLEGVPKIIAMYLNNLGDYETSEKSGRYTVMTGNTEKEVQVYEKWCDILKDLIYKKYEDKIDERTRDKLAKENARYMLSVFTPTTMGYTTSLRQWNYIVCWADRFIKDETLPNNYFFNTLKKHFAELISEINPLIHVDELYDHKERFGFDMIDTDEEGKVQEQFGRMYNIGYYGTLAQYAQAQRHRTLNYKMQFDGVSKNFYVPEIVSEFGYDIEWLEDMKSVAEYIPNGTLVYIEESGRIEDFYLKAMERNCGRAQLEIMNQTIKTAELLWEHRGMIPPREVIYMEKFYKDGKPKMKGQILSCKEPCVWGCGTAKDRII